MQKDKGKEKEKEKLQGSSHPRRTRDELEKAHEKMEKMVEKGMAGLKQVWERFEKRVTG